MPRYITTLAPLSAMSFLLVVGEASGAATDPAPTSAAPSKAEPAAATAAAPGPSGAVAEPLSAPLSGAEVIQVLDQTVNWYRTLGLQQQTADQPSDLLILYENRQIGNEVMSLAFDLARADADLLGKDAPTTAEPIDSKGSPQALTQLRAKVDAQAASVQSELDADKRALATATKKQAPALNAKIAELNGELDLVNTKKSILATLAGFASGSSSNIGSLRAQIDAMALALPSASSTTTSSAAASSTGTRPATTNAANPLPGTQSAASAPSRFGLWDLASDVFTLSQKISNIDGIDRRTADLQSTLAGIRTKIVEQLRTLSARGDALAAQADTADSATLNSVRSEFDALTNQFKQASAVFIPLSKESVLLNQYRHNLKNWRDAIRNQSQEALQRLGIRLGVLAAILAIVFALGEIWQRAVLKYIQDSRRRYQLMLIRRIALWSLVAVIVGFAFASELGSVVTFAGLITAGLAVAMQSVLVCIVGYFFLIGKYGIRIGDRVQVGDVNGEVIELGLVRMYLMEFGGHGSLGATGRLVAFPNSVVFQVASGLFKQMPGVNLSWHEIALKVPTGADYAATKEQLSAAAEAALKDYRDELEQGAEEIARTTLSPSASSVAPTVRLNFTTSGIEAHVRYPVHVQHAAEIDERMSQSLLQAVPEATGAK